VAFWKIYSFPFGQLAATVIGGALFALVVSVLRRRGAPETAKNVLLGGLVGMGYCVALWLLYLAPPIGLLSIAGLIVGVPIYIAKSRPTWSCVLIDWIAAALFLLTVQSAWWGVLSR